MDKTKTIIITISFLILAALWLQSTAWFRLQLADYYDKKGQEEKVIQLYEKVLRKDAIETKNPLAFKGKVNKETKYKIAKKSADYNYKKDNRDKAIEYYNILQELKLDREEDYFCLYYLTKQEEKLADFIIFNESLKKNIPKVHFKTPLWKFYLAKSLAKGRKWKKSESILEELLQNYPYLDTFKDAIKNIKNRRVFKQDFPIIGIWNFDKGKGDVLGDYSGMENHGEIKGAKWVEGVNGYALSFDGKGDEVVFPNNKSMELDGRDFTIAMWLKPKPQKKYRFVYNKWSISLNLHKNDKTWRFELRDERKSKVIRIKHPIENKWYFVVQRVKQDKEHKVWLFDSEGLIKTVAREDISKTSGSDGKNLGLSQKGWHKTDNAYFKGKIGGVYIFKEALGDEEVREIYEK